MIESMTLTYSLTVHFRAIFDSDLLCSYILVHQRENMKYTVVHKNHSMYSLAMGHLESCEQEFFTILL